MIIAGYFGAFYESDEMDAEKQVENHGYRRRSSDDSICRRLWITTILTAGHQRR